MANYNAVHHKGDNQSGIPSITNRIRGIPKYLNQAVISHCRCEAIRENQLPAQPSHVVIVYATSKY